VFGGGFSSVSCLDFVKVEGLVGSALRSASEAVGILLAARSRSVRASLVTGMPSTYGDVIGCSPGLGTWIFTRLALRRGIVKSITGRESGSRFQSRESAAMDLERARAARETASNEVTSTSSASNVQPRTHTRWKGWAAGHDPMVDRALAEPTGGLPPRHDRAGYGKHRAYLVEWLQLTLYFRER